MKAVNASNISKSFGKKLALDSVSFSIEKGSVFGLLGPNGAGKTTLLSVLTTLLKPSSGDAEICGYSILKQPNEARRHLSIVFQESSVDESLSTVQNLVLHAMLYKIPKAQRMGRILELVKMAGLDDVKNNLVKTYSGGMKRKVEILMGLLPSPEVLFLDEPTLGLDPRARKVIWDYILEANKSFSTTILVSTNYVEEAEYLCTHIGIMNKGKMVLSGNKAQLLDKDTLEQLFLRNTGESQ
jgi:ABC-2 type transport system ATP-binding protein